MTKKKKQLGMSMIEVMIVLVITTLITGVVFSQITLVQQRAAREQVKLDLFQQSRDFMDQMSRDLHQAGYPSPKNLAKGQVTGTSDAIAAVGLVKVSGNELQFEGDTDGSGVVKVVRYRLETDGENCPCLRRGERDKVNGVLPINQPEPSWYTEVQHVQNGTSSDPIFYAYAGGGTEITLPVAIDANPDTVATIDTIKIVLTTQAKNPDIKTGDRPSMTLVSTVRLNNCSQAANGRPMSCQ